VPGKIKIQPPNQPLTKREIEILTLVAYGKTRGEISHILRISEETVKEHVERTYRKLNASNKTHAATIALELGLIAPYQRLKD